MQAFCPLMSGCLSNAQVQQRGPFGFLLVRNDFPVSMHQNPHNKDTQNVLLFHDQ